MSLMLHRGAEEIPFAELQEAPTPQATKTHVPIAHHSLVSHVRYALGMHGHEVTEEHHGVTPDGMRYFGLLILKSKYGDYTDTVGLRNSHDKRFPVGIAMGARVFVCDNLSFLGDHVIRRKHTPNLKRELPGLVMEVVEPLTEARKAQQIIFDRYKRTELNPVLADSTIMEMYPRCAAGLRPHRLAWRSTSWLENAQQAQPSGACTSSWLSTSTTLAAVNRSRDRNSKA